MSFERLLSGTLTGLLAFVCLKFPVWGMIALERKLDVYPIVSHQTVNTLDEMAASLVDFDRACQAHQAAERDLSLVSDCYGLDLSTAECIRLVDSASSRIDQASEDMFAAVASRKALAAKADWGLLKSMTLGAQAYTHSTWLCAPPYASFTTQISLGFTPTYDQPAS